MSEHKVRVDNGKYEFIHRGAFRIDILRHGERWVEDLGAGKAVMSMMAELDAARVVVAAARAGLASGLIESAGLTAALKLHDSLVDDREWPSEWTNS